MHSKLIIYLLFPIIFFASCETEEFNMETEVENSLPKNEEHEKINSLYTLDEEMFAFNSFNELDQFQKLIADLDEIKQYEYLSKLYFENKFMSKQLLFLEEKYRLINDTIDNNVKNNYPFLEIHKNNISPKNNNEFFSVLNSDNLFKVGNYYYGINEHFKLYASLNKTELINALVSNNKSKSVFDTQYESPLLDDNLKTSSSCSDNEIVFLDTTVTYTSRINCTYYCPSPVLYFGCASPNQIACQELIPIEVDAYQNFTMSTSVSSWQTPIYDGDNEPGSFEDNNPIFQNYRHFSRITHHFNSSQPNANLNSVVAFSFNGVNATLNGSGSSSIYLSQLYSGINIPTSSFTHIGTTSSGVASNGVQVNLGCN